MWNPKKVVSKGDYNYVLLPEHPNSTKNGYVLEHRVVMENRLGRLLGADEVVHHLDGNKKNNDIENLQVMNVIAHAKLHHPETGRNMVKLKCPNCGKIFDRERRNTHFRKPSKLNVTFCSKTCSGTFSSMVQHHGLTYKMEQAISGNIVIESYNSIDNPEQTHLPGDA